MRLVVQCINKTHTLDACTQSFLYVGSRSTLCPCSLADSTHSLPSPPLPSQGLSENVSVNDFFDSPMLLELAKQELSSVPFKVHCMQKLTDNVFWSHATWQLYGCYRHLDKWKWLSCYIIEFVATHNHIYTPLKGNQVSSVQLPRPSHAAVVPPA